MGSHHLRARIAPTGTAPQHDQLVPADSLAFKGSHADYKPPFTLTAKLNKLTLKVDRPTLSPEDIKTLEAGMKKVEAGKE